MPSGIVTTRQRHLGWQQRPQKLCDSLRFKRRQYQIWRHVKGSSWQTCQGDTPAVMLNEGATHTTKIGIMQSNSFVYTNATQAQGIELLNRTDDS